ncbi:MAG TPA: hypothetical protein VM287_01350 [Egibacteraceae bacterium]|nr:hypothetical protein [Egibacteraceae bacterium]
MQKLRQAAGERALSATEGGPAEKTGAPADQPRGRRRDYRHHRRRRVDFRATEDEYQLLADAAAKLGLTPTGFAAQAALHAARFELEPKNRRRSLPDYPLLRQAIAEVQMSTNQVNRAGVNLNQAVAKFNTEGVAPSWLARAAADVAATVDRHDELVARLGALVQKALR